MLWLLQVTFVLVQCVLLVEWDEEVVELLTSLVRNGTRDVWVSLSVMLTSADPLRGGIGGVPAPLLSAVSVDITEYQKPLVSLGTILYKSSHLREFQLE